MNILLVAQFYPPCVGGVEIHAQQIAQEMNLEHCVQVVAGNFQPCGLSPRLNMLNTNLLAPSYASFDDKGVPVEALTPSSWDRLRMLPISVRAMPVLQRHAFHPLNRFGYQWFRSVYKSRIRNLVSKADIVHTLGGNTYLEWTAVEAAKDKGIPCVCTPFVHPQQWGDGPDEIACYQKADALVGLVPTDTGYLASLGFPPGKLPTIGVSPDLPPTADPEGFRRKHGLEGVPLVLYVGRMMPQKGAKAVLEATSTVWKNAPETRFVFIGPASPAESAIFGEADKRVLYLGKVSRQEKADALAACDLFCMPSLSEILPTVYLEAWSFGKPVVGGQAHGLPELVEGNGAGFAVSQNPDEVAQALLKLIQSPQLRSELGTKGKDMVEAKYSVSAVTHSLLSLYQSLLA